MNHSLVHFLICHYKVPVTCIKCNHGQVKAPFKYKPETYSFTWVFFF